MSAPNGNRFWEARSSHGRKPIFQTPDDLWNACVEYFEWVESNPLQEEKIFQFQGAIVRDTVTKMRAMTIGGMCIFLDISHQTWIDYRNREGFIEVTTRAETVIYEQKFTGAAADLLNANIIARDLGLSEKLNHDGQIDIRQLTDDELDAKLAEHLAKAGASGAA